jgi:hypothetical protein
LLKVGSSAFDPKQTSPPLWILRCLQYLRRYNSISFLFGRVEPFVSTPHELIWCVVGVKLSHPDAHCRGNGRRLCKFVPNVFRNYACRLSRDASHKQHKFIATDASDHVCSAQVSPRDLYQILQRPVANVVAVSIIDRFQVVKIKDRNA